MVRKFPTLVAAGRLSEDQKCLEQFRWDTWLVELCTGRVRLLEIKLLVCVSILFFLFFFHVLELWDDSRINLNYLCSVPCYVPSIAISRYDEK